MKTVAAVAALGLTFAAAPATMAAWVVPHVLETRGSVTSFDSDFTFDTTIFANVAGDSVGPDATGISTHTWDAPLTFSFSDSSGGAIVLELAIVSGQTVPEAAGYRTTLSVVPTWRSYNGAVVDAALAGFDLSVFGFNPEPIGNATPRIAFPTPPMVFPGADDRGRDITLSLDAGMLIIPAPAGAAIFAMAGLVVSGRRRKA